MKTLQDLLNAEGSHSLFGTWSQMSSPDILEMLGSAGFDFTVIDCEHAAFGVETAQDMVRVCRGAGLVPLVRVPTNDRSWIGRCLDAGATGIIVPGVESADQAQSAVDAAMFAPRGSRGSCPCVRSADHSTANWPEYEAAQEMMHGILALVETGEGVKNIESICAVKGLRGIVAGPFDLSVSLGHHGNVLHDDVLSSLQKVVKAAQAAKLSIFMPVFSADVEEGRRQVDVWRGLGIRHFMVGSDKILIKDQFKRYRASMGV